MTNAELLQRAAEYQAKHGRDEVLALCMEIPKQCMRIQRMAAIRSESSRAVEGGTDESHLTPADSNCAKS
jgi:hypothetical protein